ncbi:MAG: hypothetical protein JW829_01255, partial [Pirellulales bacterium]|nr:hypothetical protein [Pirellulales bacterium]
WTNGGGLYIGPKGSGMLTVQNGGSVSDLTGWIGTSAGAIGTVTVTGSGSIWKNTRDLSLGRLSDSGIGHLTITDHGTIYVGGAARSGGLASYLTVSDLDSSGLAGGHLYVYNGSTLTNSGEAVVGDDRGEFGWAIVDGADATWTNSGGLSVGLSGLGSLSILNGGSVLGTYGSLGFNSGGIGTATIDGNGSTWTNTETLAVGVDGSGTLSIQGGGCISNTDGYIAWAATGTVAVTGDGSV